AEEEVTGGWARARGPGRRRRGPARPAAVRALRDRRSEDVVRHVVEHGAVGHDAPRADARVEDAAAVARAVLVRVGDVLVDPHVGPVRVLDHDQPGARHVDAAAVAGRAVAPDGHADAAAHGQGGLPARGVGVHAASLGRLVLDDPGVGEAELAGAVDAARAAG